MFGTLLPISVAAIHLSEDVHHQQQIWDQVYQKTSCKAKAEGKKREREGRECVGEKRETAATVRATVTMTAGRSGGRRA
ncbi:hypothetical protein VIGAN_11073600 [Vigna angularis var. angularis]|uniref:Uncharacterized protein n=1 Tax=Vigna angularis var. angularis TaxID=157739 RepID=A0A0S3T957_PHAAN|nr:hypothetical protein VIGAN_11073600 [Vigna angularis var. angularis]